MTRQYAFFFDSSSCSGCKACQVACKDQNKLEVGLLWRRVYEVAGGGWQQVGQAWRQDVYAYYLSISCNHCEQPICQEVCPTGAISKRPDGIVSIDAQRCLGCQYCSWACPYGAPQFDQVARVMTKCNFCADRIDAGQPPACVAACPMRALDFGEKAELQARYGDASSAPPLPNPVLTSPALILIPHKDSARSQGEIPAIHNREEVD